MCSQLPDVVIINVKRALDDFKRHLEQCNELDFHAQEILMSVVSCLENKHIAKQQLRTFVEEVEFAERMYKEEKHISDSQADAVLNLGLEMLEEITNLSLYDEEGILLYEYIDPDIAGFNDLVLSRVCD